MNIHFIGVGEACDPLLPNTSLLVEAADQKMLLDCGFTTPHRFFANWPASDYLDLVWISHFHGDHFFGLPLLLLQFWVLGRQKKLTIAGPQGVEKKVAEAVELAYPGFNKHLQFPLHFVEIEPGSCYSLNNLSLRSAENIHSQRSLALRIDAQQQSLVYSGDGKPTPASCELAYGADLLIHESFWLDSETNGHANVLECLHHAKAAHVGALALVHMSAQIRHDEKKCERLLAVISGSSFPVSLPLPGEKIVLCP